MVNNPRILPVFVLVSRSHIGIDWSAITAFLVHNHLCCRFYGMQKLVMYFFCFSSASNRIINAKDHASIQINLAEVSIIISPD